MKVRCPKCGQWIEVNKIGRPRLDIPLKNICECIQRHSSVKSAAKELRCSEAYVFKTLKNNGLTLEKIRSKS